MRQPPSNIRCEGCGPRAPNREPRWFAILKVDHLHPRARRCKSSVRRSGVAVQHDDSTRRGLQLPQHQPRQPCSRPLRSPPASRSATGWWRRSPSAARPPVAGSPAAGIGQRVSRCRAALRATSAAPILRAVKGPPACRRHPARSSSSKAGLWRPASDPRRLAGERTSMMSSNRSAARSDREASVRAMPQR